MRPIPLKLRQELSSDPYYSRCARWMDGGCNGRITWEHSFCYAGQQINERWAIIPLCWFHHLGEGLNKAKNELIALVRASIEDLAKYPNRDWQKLKKQLEHKLFIQ